MSDKPTNPPVSTFTNDGWTVSHLQKSFTVAQLAPILAPVAQAPAATTPTPAPPPPSGPGSSNK